MCDHIAECPLTELLNNGGAPTIREFRLPAQRKHVAAAMVRVVLRALRNPAGEIVGGVEMISSPADGGATAAEHAAAPGRRGDSRRDSGADLPVLEAAERRTIEGVLRRHQWNRAETCQELGISRITLWRKMRKLGISPP